MRSWAQKSDGVSTAVDLPGCLGGVDFAGQQVLVQEPLQGQATQVLARAGPVFPLTIEPKA